MAANPDRKKNENPPKRVEKLRNSKLECGAVSRADIKIEVKSESQKRRSKDDDAGQGKVHPLVLVNLSPKRLTQFEHKFLCLLRKIVITGAV